jgi:hypothetical protein
LINVSDILSLKFTIQIAENAIQRTNPYQFKVEAMGKNNTGNSAVSLLVETTRLEKAFISGMLWNVKTSGGDGNENRRSSQIFALARVGQAQLPRKNALEVLCR